MSGIQAGYGDFQALFGVGLRVEPGEAVGVVGPNGAGKTTLLRVISGLIRPRAGTLRFGEQRPDPAAGRMSCRASASPMCRRTAGSSRI